MKANKTFIKSLAKSLTLALFGLYSVNAAANNISLHEAMKSHKQHWAKANYQLEDEAQVNAFERLIVDTDSLLESNPDSAEVWAWSGIIKSSYAAVKGGLGALSLVKDAKKDFEKALALDAEALNGATYASLGLLYHKVPGWPVAFGSDDKAEELFKKSMAINPDGRESNYFYGEFLYNEGKYVEAKSHLLTAKNVSETLWKDRPVAYKHRQEQIVEMLEKVDQRLAKRSKRR